MQSDSNNKLIIASAGSGKTTYLVRKALDIKNQSVLITTYTEANEQEIRRKFIEVNKFIPANITIQTWFSFLLQHGVRPFQGVLYRKQVNGMLLVNQQSGFWFSNPKNKAPIYYSEEKHFTKHYFNSNSKIYSDKISKFVVKCNENSNGAVANRVTRIFQNIFIDEVQDLAGYDLEIVKLLFQSSASILLVGDPRQVTYLTHNERLHSGYKDGKIDKFITEKCKGISCDIDQTSLNVSHRNNRELCDFSSMLFPDYPATYPCDCEGCRAHQSNHNGVFLIKPEDVEQYIKTYNPIILRHSGAGDNEWNFGKSKGLGFDRVLIHPTKKIIDYLKNGRLYRQFRGAQLAMFDIPKFYVAVTRPRFSAGIVYDYKLDETFIKGIKLYQRADA